MSHSPLAKSEARLAYAFLLPPLAVVLSIVLVPVMANFWISFKDVELSDLRPPKPIVKLQISQWPKNHGELLVGFEENLIFFILGVFHYEVGEELSIFKFEN